MPMSKLHHMNDLNPKRRRLYINARELSTLALLLGALFALLTMRDTCSMGTARFINSFEAKDAQPSMVPDAR